MLGGLSGAAAGVAVGAMLIGVTATVAGAKSRAAPADRDPRSLIEAVQLPPLLTVAGEKVMLRYDIYCASPGKDPEGGAPCNAGGTVFLRAGEAGPFQAIPLKLAPNAAEGRYFVAVPPEVAESPAGFSYYAVLRNEESGVSTTLPAGGADAPQRSLPMRGPVDVSLGTHVFGETRRASERVAAAPWGSGRAQAGLEGGPELQAIGATSFDVDAAGTVTVLDEANKRLLRWRRSQSVPTAIPLAIDGTLADLSIAPGGTAYVLESTGGRADETPILRLFDANGKQVGSAHVAERTASEVRVGSSAVYTHQYPSDRWLPTAVGARGLDAKEQHAGGRAGRPLPDGSDVVVLRERPDELRVALTGPAGIRRSWEITSATPLAEVQLAQPIGGRLLVVVRTYTESRDEFVVLLLDGRGLVQQFSLDSATWAETAPLTRFRLAGGSLYQLGSTPAGMFVDRFDLGVS